MRAKSQVRSKEEHVLYLGDWVFHVGPTFIETPFGTETKDADLHFYGERLTEALEHHADVTPLANWELYRLEPGKLEEYLEQSACLIISDVEAVASRLLIMQEGRVMADTTPDALLARAAGKVWSVTADQATALQLQTTCQVSTMVNQLNGITLRLVSPTRPHQTAVTVAPTLEEAYLLVTGRQPAQV